MLCDPPLDSQKPLDPEAIGIPANVLKHKIRDNLFGQNASVDEVVKFYQQREVGFNYPDRPAGVFYLLGPTGVGKTRLVELFAEAIHGHKGGLVTVDCAEMQESHTVSTLIGAPPGYVGHDDTEPRISQAKLSQIESGGKPSVILFDEFDKAHVAVSRLVLGILDKGRMRTNSGPVDFTNSFVFMTSNLGAAEMRSLAETDKWLTPVITDQNALHQKMAKTAKAQLRKHYAPEFMNRLDAVLVFNSFTEEDVGRILDLEIRRIQKALLKHADKIKFTITLTPQARALILANGYSKTENARFLKREINRLLLQKLSNLHASGQIREGDWIEVGADGARLNFQRMREGLGVETMRGMLSQQSQ